MIGRTTMMGRGVMALALILATAASLLPHGALAQGGGQVVIDAQHCPSVADGTPEPYSERCTEAGAGATFTMTQEFADGPEDETIRADDDGRVVFTIDADAESLTITGPPYELVGGEPAIRFACGGVDPDDPQIFDSPGITIEELPDQLDLSCIWYVREIAVVSSAWEGGFTNLVPGVYPEGVVALYGADSDYPEASATVEIPYWDADGVELVITGIDDELQNKIEMEVLVNGEVIFTGPSEFPDHVPGLATPGSMRFTIPAGVLQTTNTITVRNLEPVDNFGLPPWLQVREILINPT